MVIIPPIMGAILGGWRWEHALLFAFWLFGYFDFFAIGQWLRSRFKPRYRAAVITYTAIAAVFGIALVIRAPHLIVWVPAFLPLIIVTFWASWKRKDRSMLNDLVTVAAASLMLAVSFDLAVGAESVNWRPAWLATLFIFGYFVGTVFYVKTNIRERGDARWLGASVGWHVAFSVVAVTTAIGGYVSPWHAVVWLVLSIRAFAVPKYGEKNGWLTAKQVGVGEIVFSVLVAVTVLI